MPQEKLTAVVGFKTNQADKAMRALNLIVKRFGRQAEQSGNKANRSMKAFQTVMKTATRAVRTLGQEQKRAVKAEEQRIQRLGQLRRRQRKARSRREKKGQSELLRMAAQAEQAQKRAARAEERRLQKLGRVRRRLRKQRRAREQRDVRARAAEARKQAALESRLAAKAASRRRALVRRGLAIGGVAGAAGIFLAARAVRAALESFRAFERGMAEVSTILDVTDRQLAGLGKRLQAFSILQGQKQSDTIRAFYQVVSAGVTDASDAMVVLRASSNLAIAGLTSQEIAVNIVTTALNAYGFAAQDAAFITDILFTTVRLGKTRAEELATTMGRVVGIAAAAGIRFEELNAAVAVLTRVQPTEIAITSLRGVITGILSPSKQAAERFAELGVETDAYTLAADGMESVLKDIAVTTKGSAFELSKLFENIRALSAITVLAADGGRGFADAMKQMEDSAGAAGTAAEKMMNTTDFAMRQLGARFEEIKTTAGSALGSVIVWITGVTKNSVRGAQAVEKFADAFAAFQRRVGRRGFTAAENLQPSTEAAFFVSREFMAAQRVQKEIDIIGAKVRELVPIFKAAGEAGFKALRQVAAEQERFIEGQDRSAKLAKGLASLDFSTLTDAFKAFRGKTLEDVQEIVSTIAQLGDIQVSKLRNVFKAIQDILGGAFARARRRGGDPEGIAFALKNAAELAREAGIALKESASATEILDAVQKKLKDTLKETGQAIQEVNESGQKFAQGLFTKAMEEAVSATEAQAAASRDAAAAVRRQRVAFDSLKEAIGILKRLRSEAQRTRDALADMQRTIGGRRFERAFERAGRVRGGAGRARRLRQLRELNQEEIRGRNEQARRAAREARRRAIQEERRRIAAEERAAERAARERQRRRLRRRLAGLERRGQPEEAARLAEREAALLGRRAEATIRRLEDQVLQTLQTQQQAAQAAETQQQQAVTTMRANVAQLGAAATLAIDRVAAAQQDVSALFAKAIKDAKELGLIAEDIPVTVDTSQAQQAIANLRNQLRQLRQEAGVGGVVGSGGRFAQGMASGGMIYAQGGMRFPARGPDTVPAMLTPGEMVINRSATRANRGILDAINRGQNVEAGTTINQDITITFSGAQASPQDIAEEIRTMFRNETIGVTGSFNPLTRNKPR